MTKIISIHKVESGTVIPTELQLQSAFGENMINFIFSMLCFVFLWDSQVFFPVDN